MLKRSHEAIYAKTIIYFSGLVSTLTFSEATACLRDLGHYDMERLWFVKDPLIKYDKAIHSLDREGTLWESKPFYRVPIKGKCRIANVHMPIHFNGGPPGYYNYHAGILQTFVTDRILRSCVLLGKTQTSHKLGLTLSRVRRAKRLIGC